MMLIAVFVLFFVAGPLGFRALTAGTPTGRKTRRLALLMALAAASALAMRYGIPDGVMEPAFLAAGIVFFVWLAWIAGLALGTQALRRIDPSPRMHRSTRIGGMLCTTVPWFGLAAADMVGF